VTRIPVGILGATGAVGQRFVQLLAAHPWFEVTELVASDRSAGKPYREAARWKLPGGVPAGAAERVVTSLGKPLESKLLFSGLDSSVAGEAEEEFAANGHAVISNSRNHRHDPDVPLLIPEVNADHLGALEVQRVNADHLGALEVQRRRTGGGYIVTNPNCVVVGLAMVLAPLHRAFGVESVAVATLQALSGAGYPGVPSFDLTDNVLPYIGGGEEDKIENEPLKILGGWNGKAFEPATVAISASVHRVGVVDGHTMALFLNLKKKASPEEAAAALGGFRGEPQERGLPTAPRQPIHVLEAQDRPQPRLDRDREGGMAVSVGRVRDDRTFDLRLEALAHNTIRGAAGAAILNGELLHARGLLPDA
jgi:aspartate-semialdehyde dehydrogenase